MGKKLIGRHAVRGNSDSALGVELEVEVGRLTLDGLRIRCRIKQCSLPESHSLVSSLDSAQRNSGDYRTILTRRLETERSISTRPSARCPSQPSARHRCGRLTVLC